MNGLTHGGRVDDRHQLGQVVFQNFEVQQLMAVMQLLEEQVAAQIGCQALQLMPHPVGLLIEGEHRRGKPAGQPEPPPLFVSESDSAVQARHGQRRRDPRRVGIGHRATVTPMPVNAP